MTFVTDSFYYINHHQHPRQNVWRKVAICYNGSPRSDQDHISSHSLLLTKWFKIYHHITFSSQNMSKYIKMYHHIPLTKSLDIDDDDDAFVDEEDVLDCISASGIFVTTGGKKSRPLWAGVEVQGCFFAAFLQIESWECQLSNASNMASLNLIFLLHNA